MTEYTAPPSDLLMQIANDPSEENFRASFPGVREATLSYLKAANLDFYEFENVLDFGCGVGRFLFAMKEISGSAHRFFGCDINDECFNWCKGAIQFAQIDKAPLRPPILGYENNSMDYINAVSVFTHLTLDSQFQWAWEIYRILRPGGVIAVTTNGHAHMPFLLNLPKDLFPIRELWTFGDDAFFGSLSTADSQYIEGQREVVTMHSSEALAETFYPLEHLLYVPISTLAGGQSMSIFRKPRPGTIITPTLVGEQFRFSRQPFSAKFRAFLSFEFDNFAVRDESVDYAITDIEDSNPQIASFQLSLNRIFKSTQLVPITINIPPRDQEFAIVVGRQPGSRLSPFMLHFPHLIITS